MAENIDCAVIGAGVVGLAIARRLARNGREVVILEAEEETRQIVRVKRFTLTPMDEDEATEQMELLGHDFFIFYTARTAEVNVVYRRHDGNYGLLQPQLP
jgi:putative sigma-54 modulation protein